MGIYTLETKLLHRPFNYLKAFHDLEGIIGRHADQSIRICLDGIMDLFKGKIDQQFPAVIGVHPGHGHKYLVIAGLVHVCDELVRGTHDKGDLPFKHSILHESHLRAAFPPDFDQFRVKRVIHYINGLNIIHVYPP